MILLVLAILVVGVGACIGFLHAARQRPLSAFDVRTAVLAGSVIAAVRLAVFWTALALSQRPDGRPGIGYVLMGFDAAVELLIVSAARNTIVWPMLIYALIVVTSFFLGWAWAWSVAPNPEPGTRR